MKTLSLKKICVVMSQIPDSTSPRFFGQLDVLQQMGYFLRIVSLESFPANKYLFWDSKLAEQSISLRQSKRQIPRAILTLLLLGIIAPLRSFRTFGTMLKMLFYFKDRKAVIKNYLQAGMLVNHHIIDKEIGHLHTHCERNALRTSYLASLLTGLNTSCLALPGEIFEPDFLLLKSALLNCSFIFTLSEYEKKFILEEVFEGIDLLPNIFCFLNGIDLEKFKFVLSPDSKEPYLFVTTAYLSKKKGLDTVLCALRELKNQGFVFEYRVIGDGHERENLEEMTKTLGLENEVIFTGIKARYEIPKLLEKADLFLLAPRILKNGEQDSMPLGIKEAMATGVPVVATDCGAVRELIESGETGLLVSMDDVLAFAAACKSLLTDHELRNQIILKARLQIEGVYDIHKQAQIFNDYINNHELPL
ncbi:MAG: glycosyltransferase family 4 protein [Victivallales bacterium]|nr:glycosyltransferase family 4 protein [Victivallales bacterium]